jgi:hypothetical protein
VNRARDAVAEFFVWLLAGGFVSLLISPVTYYLFNMGKHHITYAVALGITALLVFVGVVIIKVADDGEISL